MDEQLGYASSGGGLRFYFFSHGTNARCTIAPSAARDLMRYHAGTFTDPRQAVDEARAILAMAAAVQGQDPGPYAALLPIA